MDFLLQLDKRIFLALNFDGGTFLDEFFWIVSGKLTWVPLYLLIIFLIYRRYGWKSTLVSVIFMVLAVIASDAIASLFKNGIPKLRPSHNPEFEGIIHRVHNYLGHRYGTVSAHAATVFSVMVFSSALVRTKWFTIMTLTWALLVGYSRIYIGAHYPMDVICGSVLGILMAVLMLKLFRMITARWLENKADAPQTGE